MQLGTRYSEARAAARASRSLAFVVTTQSFCSASGMNSRIELELVRVFMGEVYGLSKVFSTS